MGIMKKSRYNGHVILNLLLKYRINLENEGREGWIMFWLFQVSLSQAQYAELQTEEAKHEETFLAI
jgi:hypothetical protein